MQRLILLILLLTVVFSWEELKYASLAIWSKIRKRNKTYEKNFEADTLVSDLVLIASIPLSLAYLILGTENLSMKLLVILVEFLFLGLILRGIEEYHKRRYFTRDYQGADKFIAIVFSLTGLVSPSMRFAGHALRSGTKTGKHLITLAFPLAAGLALTLAVRKLGKEEFVAQTDTLIVIAVLAIALNITVEILEHMFRVNRYNFTSLLRVVFGVLILFSITSF